MDLGLGGRAAIVTGASKGIGRQVALTLADAGCRVLLCARDATALEAVLDEITDRGGTAATLAIDLTERGAEDHVVATCQAEFGRLDVLVNNAGGAVAKPIAALTAQDWQDGLELNFLAAARLAAACVEPMRAAGWGRLVHVASVSGREPDPLFAPYGAAKAALLHLSGSLSAAFAADGVLSNCVVPGVTLTDLVETNAQATAAHTGRSVQDVLDRMLAKHPVSAGRFGRPEEVAAAIVFLASEQASWITGATLEVDGGTLRGV